MSARGQLVVAVSGAVAFALVAWYLASPLLALSSLGAAVKAGDRDRLSIMVDFPSVRASLKDQFTALLSKKMAGDKGLADNPIAGGLTMLFAPMVVDRFVDAMVTPDGLATVLKRPFENTNSAGQPNVHWIHEWSYIDLDHFKETISDRDEPNLVFGLVLERRGIFSWKLVRLDLPEGELVKHEPSDSNSAQPDEQAPPTADAARPSPPSDQQQPAPAAPEAQNGGEAPAQDQMPKTVGACAETVVSSIGTRLEGVPDSGSEIDYANGGHQVSYDAVDGIVHSAVGDHVRLCLESLPTNCPPGDDRGRIYHAINLRTFKEWSEPDSEHSCGGA